MWRGCFANRVGNRFGTTAGADRKSLTTTSAPRKFGRLVFPTGQPTAVGVKQRRLRPHWRNSSGAYPVQSESRTFVAHADPYNLKFFQIYGDHDDTEHIGGQLPVVGKETQNLARLSLVNQSLANKLI